MTQPPNLTATKGCRKEYHKKMIGDVKCGSNGKGIYKGTINLCPSCKEVKGEGK